MFTDAVAAGDVAAVQRNLLPEELRGVTVERVAGQFEFASGPDELGYLGVGVESAERITPLRGEVHHRVMVEALRDHEITRIFCGGGEVGQYFVHAAEFGLQG